VTRRHLGPLAVLAGALLLSGADWRTVPRGEGPDAVPVQSIDGTAYVGVNGLARLLDATKFWRADVRKLVLRSGRHSITFTVDNPFVVVDDATLWLPFPVLSSRGELQIPAMLVDSLPSDSSLARLFFDRRRARVVVLPASGGVGSPTITAGAAATRLVFPADRPDEAVVVARSRAHLRLRFGGFFTGAVPESVPAGGLLRALRPIAAAGGSAFECEVAREAVGFRLLQDTAGRRVVLELLRDAAPGAEAFAPEGPRGPRPLRVIVLDPGHGGNDPGVIAGTAVEKDLTLSLATVLKTELEHRLRARIVLTRADDRNLTADQRAEVANRSRADLVLALHFDGLPASGARGATAYCPPATFVEAGDAQGARASGAAGSQPFQLLPWRDVAARHAVQSRSLAEAILSALELRGEGPTRLRDRLPCALLGVNAPGLLLECATLTSPADRERVQQEAGMRQLAATIAEGILAWQRNE
jgi:N-acetylmuramoyl-L-alanine amidase